MTKANTSTESTKTQTKKHPPLRNYFPGTFTAVLYTIIKISILYFCLKRLGFIYGMATCFSSFLLYNYFILYVFKLEWMNNTDKLFINQHEVFNYTIGGLLYIENFDKNVIRKEIKEKLFDKLPKVSASVETFLGDFYWNTPQVKDFSTEKKQGIMNSRIKDVLLDNESQIKAYIEAELQQPINPFITPIEFLIIEFRDEVNNSNSKKKGCVYTKVDHSLSDGLGMMALLSFMDKEYSINKYPAMLRNKPSGFTHWKNKIIDITLGVFLGLFTFLWFVIQNARDSNKLQRIVKSTNSLSQFQHKRDCEIADRASFDLAKIKAFSKKAKATINDVIVYAMLKTLKKLSPESTKVPLMCPVGFSSIPHSIEEIELWNVASAYLDVVKLPSLEGLGDKNDKNRFKLINITANLFKVRFQQIMNHIMGELLHFNLQKLTLHQGVPQVVLTNVPAQEKPIEIGSCIVTDMSPMIHTGATNIFIGVVSYNGKLNISLSCWKEDDLNPNQVIKDFKNIIESMIEEKED
eukprot:CAMPEP_0170527030 /NCGR_PEP_ID=MMETSP0209-20121228/12451_1 /TAXON_ID=665100 ORGANISM="Litonotus pictus, Strain P1" /NCGR_SAMPLE_ID=MMETSP0209 /ASSEMBLY_ACC=CAM_ASM_000301 /LENGTH=520 /DNA_ID=CAMNT_0010817247 /DNA_START=1 /DNA_END=1563 /DNA_ORIENTATION=-